MSKTIGIVGVGMVGNAVSEFYKTKPGITINGYDKMKELGTLEAALGSDFVFLCLPSLTKSDGSQDLTAFEETLPKLLAGSKVIIKSTVIPGTTAQYQKARPDVFFFHNPEFLDARTAVNDFAQPDFQIVGTTEQSKPFAEEVMAILPEAPEKFFCTTDESEMVKYFMNTFMATKNTFANQMYDYCLAKGINYDTVKDIVKHAPRMGGEVHLRVLQDGYRGFQGACLPKDIAALIHDAQTAKHPLPLLEKVEELNKDYVKEKRT